MERLTNSDKEIPTLSDNAEYWLKAYFKLKDYEDLEELIGVSLKDLTKIFNDHIPEDCKNPKKTIVLTDEDVDRWNGYKKAEKQGLLLRLPCKVGDTVYIIYSDKETSFIEEPIVKDVSTHRIWIESRCYDYSDIGKTIFLAKAEAEQKLKEMEG